MFVFCFLFWPWPETRLFPVGGVIFLFLVGDRRIPISVFRWKLEEKDIYVVKYDNEKPEIDGRTVWCTIYGDDEDDIYFGLDRIVKLVRGDILRGSKWCGKHYRFSE